MQVFKTHKKLNEALKGSGISLGMVPTMGALHEGHLALIRQALKENDRVVVSIFVNPTQFNDAEDLKNYPRNLDDDLAQLEPLGAALYIYTPKPQDLYAEGVVAQPQHLMGLDLVMEGAFRQHHFDGVATVVEKLLRSVNPDRAYFGEKDFQQLTIIKELNKQLKLGVEIISCPIIREKNGLAMSSRNQLLSPKDREEAKVIFKSLEAILKHAEKWTPHQMKQFFIAEVENLKGFKVEYFSVASPSDLIPVDHIEQHKMYRIFVAVYAGKTRLIDTVELKRK